jgi:4a-hydroxytetrahydrobiopterin dehydratase
VPPLTGAQIEPLLAQLDGWRCIDEHHLEKRYRLRNFREALALTQRIGEVAEEQDHHPDLSLGWGYVGVQVFTHKVKGLTESDFVLAAKCDREAEALRQSSSSSSRGSGAGS